MHVVPEEILESSASPVLFFNRRWALLLMFGEKLYRNYYQSSISGICGSKIPFCGDQMKISIKLWKQYIIGRC